MDILILMVPMAILISFGFLLGFAWAVKNNQFDDLETPSHRVLFDDIQ